MIKNIIFDFGGVLVDWNSQRFIASIFLFLRRERDSLAQFFLRVSFETIRSR